MSIVFGIFILKNHKYVLVTVLLFRLPILYVSLVNIFSRNNVLLYKYREKKNSDGIPSFFTDVKISQYVIQTKTTELIISFRRVRSKILFVYGERERKQYFD
ncbi:hypothetical protein ADO06_01846 [Streptococcus parauberis]|nr:hypothetical protein ADO06_01846 [Streptococcus parauberis]